MAERCIGGIKMSGIGSSYVLGVWYLAAAALAREGGNTCGLHL
jgi:hypothetical protein